MKSFGKQLLYKLAAIFLIAMYWLTRCIPLPALRAIARVTGRVAYYFLSHIRKVGHNNLDLVYGDTLTHAEKKSIVVESIQNVAIVAMEFSRLPLIQKHQDQWFDISGMEHIDSSRGAIFITGHIANWEWLGPTLAAAGVPTAEVVRTFEDPWLDRLIDGVRRAGKVKTIPRQNAGTDVAKCLKENVQVGILVDQSTHDNGVPVTFFGQPCWATAAPAMLALRKKIPIHIFTAARGEDGKYHVTVTPPLEYEQTGDFRENIQQLTQSFQDEIEAHVRKYPGQWLWLYRRWKKRDHLMKKWEEQSRKSKAKTA